MHAGFVVHSVLLGVGAWLALADLVQALYGSVLAMEDLDFGLWPPAPVLEAYAWWCETVDPLLAHNPLW